MKRLIKILLISFLTILSVVALFFVTFQFTPWPSVLAIRYYFNQDGVKTNEALKKHVPDSVSEIIDQVYSANDQDAKLDVYFPTVIANTTKMLPTIVWVHGGGWISGDKAQVANYCKILASKGYCVIAINYSIAPENTYPLPLIQTNEAIKYIVKNAGRFHANPSNFIFAGDSAGSHIATQLAAVISNNAYAKLTDITPAIQPGQLSGLLLYCGAYDTSILDMTGGANIFLKTILWSYSGKKDFLNLPEFKTAAVINYVNSDFPPSFISAGNDDPLLPQSIRFVEKLRNMNVSVDTLFFKPDFNPPLPHEYQFNLDNAAGKLALERSVKFLTSITK